MRPEKKELFRKKIKRSNNVKKLANIEGLVEIIFNLKKGKGIFVFADGHKEIREGLVKETPIG